MSICLPFLLYVCGFFSKDHAYTSIEDSMAIGDPRVDDQSLSLDSKCKLRVFQNEKKKIPIYSFSIVNTNMEKYSGRQNFSSKC